MLAGIRVAVRLATLAPHRPERRAPARLGLRFDKVATRVVERLRIRLAGSVPDGMTLLVMITAPIRLPGQTAATLEVNARPLLARRRAGRDEQSTIHGNRVR